MTRDLRDYIEDIAEQIRKIENFTDNITDIESFQKNEMAVYACIRALEIMGEAVKHVPDDFRQNYPQIPWRRIAGIRDVLIHAYFGVDTRVIWHTVTISLPEIKPVFEKILTEEFMKKDSCFIKQQGGQ